MSAAFSAIIITGALMLPLIRSGITEASIDAQPLDAAHPQVRIDHGALVVVAAHLAGAERVMKRDRGVADVLVERRVGCKDRVELAGDERLHLRLAA